MSKANYKNRIENFKSREKLCKVIYLLYTYLPVVMFICYPVTLIIKAFMGFDLKLLLMILIPASVLLIVTAIRKIVNRPRPYEKYNIPSLFKRDGNGESFPSRHTASAFVLAMSGFALSPYLGTALLIIACIIALTRILAGVHFVSDVIAGMVISVGAGSVFFFI